MMTVEDIRRAINEIGLAEVLIEVSDVCLTIAKEESEISDACNRAGLDSSQETAERWKAAAQTIEDATWGDAIRGVSH